MFFIYFTFKKSKHKTTMFGSILKNIDARKYKILDILLFEFLKRKIKNYLQLFIKVYLI